MKMRKQGFHNIFKYQGYILALAILSWAVSVSAEPAGPKNFFTEGFTSGLVKKDATQHFDNNVVIPRTTQQDLEFKAVVRAQIKPDVSDLDGSEDEFARAPNLPSGEELAPSLIERKGIPILGIGVLVSVNDQGHLIQQMNTMTRSVVKYNFPITDVYFMGNYVDLFRSRVRKKQIGTALTMIPGAGGQLKMAPEFPEKYGLVQSSPVWILSTHKGEILLEGITDLPSYINSDGEYVDRKSFSSRVVDVLYEGFEDENQGQLEEEKGDVF